MATRNLTPEQLAERRRAEKSTLARLDPTGTATPKTRIVTHARPDSDGYVVHGPGPLIDPLHEDVETGTRTTLAHRDAKPANIDLDAIRARLDPFSYCGPTTIARDCEALLAEVDRLRAERDQLRQSLDSSVNAEMFAMDATVAECDELRAVLAKWAQDMAALKAERDEARRLLRWAVRQGRLDRSCAACGVRIATRRIYDEADLSGLLVCDNEACAARYRDDCPNTRDTEDAADARAAQRILDAMAKEQDRG
jgi:hypothetical protein